MEARQDGATHKKDDEKGRLDLYIKRINRAGF